VKADRAREIAWGLKVLGGVHSDVITDGESLIYRAWVPGGKHANGTDILATAQTLDGAVNALWGALTTPGSYVIIGTMKYTYHQGGFQQNYP
jgi:hypothetical protein